MDLKSGCMFWPQLNGDLPASYPKLNNNFTCDVAIIGGGISGALSGYFLTHAGVHVALVDRRVVAQGSTVASTGLLQYEIDTPLTELAEKIGQRRAKAAYRASLDALLAFDPLVDSLNDPCGLVARPSLYLASTEKDVVSLQQEADARRSMDIDVQFLPADELLSEFNIRRPAALWSKKAFEIDPFRLTRILLRRSAEMGMSIFDETEVNELIPSAGGMTLGTINGPRIYARKIIVATGYETMQKLPADLCQLYTTYALASEPLKSFDAWPHRCMIWESARPYHYLRTTTDGRAIVGGGDDPLLDPETRLARLPDKTAQLLEAFGKIFPDIPIETNCSWCGVFAQTKDGLPYIGTLPRFPHTYFALGYGGNGITFSLIAAQILRDLFLGRENPLAGLFGFGR